MRNKNALIRGVQGASNERDRPTTMGAATRAHRTHLVAAAARVALLYLLRAQMSYDNELMYSYL